MSQDRPYEIRNGRVVVGAEKDKQGRRKRIGGPYRDDAQGRIRAAKKVAEVMQRGKDGRK